MSDYEHCCECNERTGRAGPSDDSLYLGSVGPFCEDCVDTRPDKMTEEYGRLMAMNAELTEEIEHLEDLIIKLGQMLREIVNITKGPPEENSWHSTHDAVESVERLQARVVELVAVAVSVRDDLLLRSEINSDGTRCVNLSASKWSSFCDVIDDNNSEAFILRKQAEAVDGFLKVAKFYFPQGCGTVVNADDVRDYGLQLREEANKAESNAL